MGIVRELNDSAMGNALMVVSCLLAIKRVTREGLTYFRTSLSGYDSVLWLR